MNKVENKKKKQVNEIVAIVKIASLLLTSIVFFQYLGGDVNELKNYSQYNYSLISSGAVTVILLAAYSLWAFGSDNMMSITWKYRNVENVIFVVIFTMSIMLSGVYKSESKYIFLFIIITTTIQSGIKSGVIMASISSIIILSIDLIFAPSAVVNQYFQSDLILCGVFILTAWPLGFYVKVEGEHIKKLEELVNLDGLTGVYNHRYFQEQLKSKIEISTKAKEPISMIFIDIDYFKHYNDLYGHQEGDEVLKTLGKILSDNIRKNDVVARYGGEEFALLLPNTNEEDAIVIANELRLLIEKTKFYGEENQPKGKLTVSMGVSVYPNKAKTDIELIKSADDALYRAKFFNKNRVETYTSILDGLKNDTNGKDLELITSIKTLISVINAKDRYTYSHCERIVCYCRLLATKLNLSETDTNTLVYGGYMHDIGKINVAKEILIKKMPLDKDEWEIMKQHPQNGIDIIKSVKSLEKVAPIIYHHHEKYNGTG
ncbi:MAG: diguanylate cyclase, partial [Clostridium sp.]